MFKKMLSILIGVALCMSGCSGSSSGSNSGSSSSSISGSSSSSISGSSSGSSSSTIDFNYKDDSIPGSDYNYSIDTKNKVIKMNIKHFDSTLDGKPKVIDKEVKIDNDKVFNYIIDAYNHNVLDDNSDWAYVFCSDLEGIDKVLKDEVIAKKDDVDNELWEVEYSDSDLNDDDVVTALEDFEFVWEQMLYDLGQVSKNDNK